jgi:hypothetical protein
MDTQGNAYVTGSFRGTASFGAITVTSVASSSDVFVAKYDPGGHVQWVVTAGGDDLESGECISVGANGEVLVAGGFNSKAISVGGKTITPVGDMDVFAWKFLPPDA